MTSLIVCDGQVSDGDSCFVGRRDDNNGHSREMDSVLWYARRRHHYHNVLIVQK